MYSDSMQAVYPPAPRSRKPNSGFTIVELLIVIVIIGILAAIVITIFVGIQVRARNTAMIVGVKSYLSAIEGYHSLTGIYPTPPDGTDPHDLQACFGNNYLDGYCLTEDDGPGMVTSQAWFDDALSQVAGNTKPLPKYLQWNSDGNDLIAGAFYIYTKDTHHTYLDDAGLESADALVVFYLEGNHPEMCAIRGDTAANVYLVGMSTDKDLTICYTPIGDYKVSP